LIFAAHRVLGYSSNDWYAEEGAFEEPMGRESLQKLWQKYKVDIAFLAMSITMKGHAPFTRYATEMCMIPSPYPGTTEMSWLVYRTVVNQPLWHIKL
jgi:hypothetical protein